MKTKLRIFVIARASILFLYLSLTAFGGVLNTYVNSARATSKESSGFFIKENYMEEIWKPIPNCENYEASTKGRVRNCYKKILKQRITGRSLYLMTGLYKDGVRRNCTVHRLIALTFTPNPENKRCVNHRAVRL